MIGLRADRISYIRKMSCVIRKPAFGVPDQVPHKPSCTAIEDSSRLEISEFGSRGMVKTKALISCTVNVPLICIFVFAYAKRWFSRDVAQSVLRKQ